MFSKSDDVRAGLKRKYQSDFEAYTFGVEFEFLPEIRDAAENKRDIINSIVAAVRSGKGELTKRFEREYPNLPKENFEAVALGFAEYMSGNDYYLYYLEDLQLLPPRRNFNKTIEAAAKFIRDQLHEPVQTILDGSVAPTDAQKTNWQADRDGSNVEVRTRHMQQTDHDFSLVDQFGKWIAQTQKTNKNSGMHVHIGLPQDMDAFDLLAIVDVVDERSIVQFAGSKRDAQFNAFTKPKRETVSALISWLLAAAGKKLPTTAPKLGKLTPFKFELSYKEAEAAIGSIADRDMGINLHAVNRSKTIEFRYAGTDTADKIVKLVKYYCLIPKVAQTRNRIVLTDTKHRQTLVAIRKPDNIEFVYGHTDHSDVTASQLNLPATDIKKEKQKQDRARDLKHGIIEI